MSKEREVVLMTSRDNFMISFVEEYTKKVNWIETKHIIESADGFLLEQKLYYGKLEFELSEDEKEKKVLLSLGPEEIMWVGVYENGIPVEVISLPEERGKMIEKDKITFIFGKEENIKKIKEEGKDFKFVNMDEMEKEKTNKS